jgi:peptidoglycan-associated lipoprotein
MLRFPAADRTIIEMVFMLLLLVLMAGCGPTYPECDQDRHCEAHNQVCVDKVCSDCRDDSQCTTIDPCMTCARGNVCERREGCCKSDLDCPDGRCWKGNEETGTCGGQCQSDDHCPPGQACSGGSCVPNTKCKDDSGCAPGEKCISGRCAKSACEIKSIYFDFNETVVRLDQEEMIATNARCLKARMLAHHVTGHCDERGSDEFNLALSQRRAGSVARAYSNLGVPSGRLSTIGYGEETPFCVESTEACWQKNRRVETIPQ